MNILFLMADQWHPDYVGYVARSKAPTPNIDWIAGGTWFEAAVTPNPVCMPARSALLTGKYPHQVGTLTMSGDLDPQYPTYARALQSNGYYTAAVGKLHFLQGWWWNCPRGRGHNLVELKEQVKRYGFDDVWEASGKQLMNANTCDYAEYLRGKGLLDHYRDEIERRAALGQPEYPGTSESFGIREEDHVETRIADQLIDLIKNQRKDRPFCIFGSFLSPHPIIDPPERFLTLESEQAEEMFLQKNGGQPLNEELKRRWFQYRRGYRASIRFVDYQIGRILSALRESDLLDHTLIIFTSDHGDLLGDFGADGKNRPERASSNVPLAIRHPAHVTGRGIAFPVSLIDVTATILDAAGLDPQTELSLRWPAWNHVVPSRSLMPVIRGEQEKVRDYAFAENDGWEMIQTRDFKYVRYRLSGDEYATPIEEFYDLDVDPDELTNMVGEARYRDRIQWCRNRRDYVLNSTPCGQTGWAPVGAEEYAVIPTKSGYGP